MELLKIDKPLTKVLIPYPCPYFGAGPTEPVLPSKIWLFCREKVLNSLRLDTWLMGKYLPDSIQTPFWKRVIIVLGSCEIMET